MVNKLYTCTVVGELQVALYQSLNSSLVSYAVTFIYDVTPIAIRCHSPHAGSCGAFFVISSKLFVCFCDFSFEVIQCEVIIVRRIFVVKLMTRVLVIVAYH